MGQVDRWVWRRGVEGVFLVRSCYDHVAAVVGTSGPWKVIWYNAILLKAQFFLWTTSLEKISSMNMLRRKGFYLPSICLLCYRDVKSSYHLLIHCSFSWEVWCSIARLWHCFCCSLKSLSVTPGMECGSVFQVG